MDIYKTLSFGYVLDFDLKPHPRHGPCGPMLWTECFLTSDCQIWIS